tara:strand:+ start:184 stop:1125 length:942 start_codon:yes stop_codon:yes gene_type:complete
MPRFLALPLLLALTFSACSAVPQAPFGAWEAPLHRHHALVGTVWSVREEQSISAEQFLQRLGAARFVILGEKHDNPDHHKLQRYVLAQLDASKSLDRVSFEMLDSSQQGAIDSLNPAIISSFDELRSALSWDAQGWDWSFYGPLVQDSLLAGATVRSANISNDEMMAVYAAAPNAANDGILDAAQMQRLHQEIDESHCGMLPESQFPAMVAVQQARDAAMAQSLLSEGGSSDGVRVLIAGNFHARRDLGVPNYVGLEQGALISVAFLEVSPESGRAQEYLESFSANAPYDYVWFTPALAVQDYCAGLRSGASE